MNGDGGTSVTTEPRPTLAQLALIYDAVSDPIILLAVEGEDPRILSVNAAFCTMLRVTPSDVIGKTMRDISDSPERPSRFREACRRAVVEKQPVRYEEHTSFRGRRVSALINLTPILDDAGVVTHLLSVSRDITHETSVVEALRASEQNLEATLRSIGDGVIATDVDGRVVRMNTHAEITTGVVAVDARARPLHEVFRLVDAKSRVALPSPALSVLKDGRVVDLGHDALLVAKNGVERAISASAAPIKDGGGGVVGVVIIYRDVTPERRAAAEKRAAEAERRRTETALRESEARYRTQFEHAPEAILTLDVEIGRFVEANGNALRLLGQTREEIMRVGPLEVSPTVQPDGRFSWEVASEYIARAIAGDVPVFEWTLVDKGERMIPTEIRLVRLPGAGMHCRASIIDITDRKQAELLKRHSRQLLEENRLIHAANRLKSEFVANMSHELRTPLNAILGFAELLHDGKIGQVSGEQKDVLADVLASGRHLLSLINGMLDLAKVESGRMELSPAKVDLGALVAEVADVLRALAARKRIELQAEVEAGIGVVVVDPARLKQVLFNYLSNALKFTPEGGVVTVRAAPEGERAFRVAVEDTGVGIRDEDVGKLFTEFSQLDAGMTKQHEGTGLGLALTKRIVEAQGGTVGVMSVPGRGSTFYAVLPR